MFNLLLSVLCSVLIANLEGQADINSEHVSEAIQYRTLDRKYSS